MEVMILLMVVAQGLYMLSVGLEISGVTQTQTWKSLMHCVEVAPDGVMEEKNIF